MAAIIISVILIVRSFWNNVDRNSNDAGNDTSNNRDLWREQIIVAIIQNDLLGIMIDNYRINTINDESNA